jgi:hypothetical protein
MVKEEVGEETKLKERFGAKDPYDASRAKRYPLTLPRKPPR